MNVMLTRAIELADVGGVNFSTLQLRWRGRKSTKIVVVG